MEWSLPPGWHGKLSVSKGRWFFWHDSDPTATTWTPPSWNAQVSASYNANLHANPESSLFRSCQNFCKSAVLSLWLFHRLAPDSRVLDVGCGKGGDGGKVPPTFFVTGIDIADEALAEARRRFPAKSFVHADFSHPTLSLQQQLNGALFDAAWSSFAFHYGGDALDVALRNVRSVLRRGASFLFIVLDEHMERDHPSGFGPLQISKWEHRDVGGKGTCASASRCWVSFSGSFDLLPECVLSEQQIKAACEVSSFQLICSLRLGASVQNLFDWADTPEAQTRQAHLQDLRSKFKDWKLWDSTHFAFANCYRVWLLESI